MKLILENWRRLLEGDVIQFPHQPKVSEEDLQFTIEVENNISNRLSTLYGNISEIPIDKLEKLDLLMNELQELLTK